MMLKEKIPPQRYVTSQINPLNWFKLCQRLCTLQPPTGLPLSDKIGLLGQMLSWNLTLKYGIQKQAVYSSVCMLSSKKWIFLRSFPGPFTSNRKRELWATLYFLKFFVSWPSPDPLWAVQSFFPVPYRLSSLSQLRRLKVGQTEHVRGTEMRGCPASYCPLSPGRVCVCVCVCGFGFSLMHWVFSFSWCSICGSIHGDTDLWSHTEGRMDKRIRLFGADGWDLCSPCQSVYPLKSEQGL